ncbi:predicted protein [Uncinocarpus reesii 1704]|uniref:Uncharacterized protein n=1 Tax=Uncinocarpus reesii (strain UAMH 1704) TaxID=336963 RepID=C4JN71_UNCRE|nr:uncharacterized protein UREG_04279 [Uncinocarpus reesii 1704]EEP79433.1 predicted protein [Uncinocarpus reesii 1704]
MSRTAAQFIQDVSSGEKIYMDIFKAACSWDLEAKMQDIVDNSGYDLSPANLKAAYEAPPKWSLAMFGGEYFFSEPPDLKGKSLFVNPTTEQVIMLDDIQEPDLQPGKDATYKWTITSEDDGTSETYTITFDVGFKINELPSSHSCQGARESDSKPVKAAQRIPDKDDRDRSKVPDPKDTGDGVNDFGVIGAWIGVSGLALVGLVFAYVMYKQRKSEATLAQSNADAASASHAKDEATLKEKARKAKDALIKAASELKTKVAAHWQARQTFQYIEMEEMRHPNLDVEYASLQRPVDATIESYLGDYLAQHTSIKPEDLNTKAYENTLKELQENATLLARQTFLGTSRDRATEESDRKYAGLAELSELADGVYHDTVRLIGETVAEKDFDARDTSLGKYVPIVLDAYIQKEIARLAWEHGEEYSQAATEANQAAEKARSDKEEKEQAKEEVERQLEDQTISDEKRIELEAQRDELQAEIAALGEEEKKQEEKSSRDSEEAKKETERAKDADEKAGEKRKESNRHGEKIFTKK